MHFLEIQWLTTFLLAEHTLYVSAMIFAMFVYFNLTKWFVSSNEYFCNRDFKASFNNTTVLTGLLCTGLGIFVSITQHRWSSKRLGGQYLRRHSFSFWCNPKFFLSMVFQSMHIVSIDIFQLWLIRSYCSCNCILRWKFSHFVTLHFTPLVARGSFPVTFIF